MKRLRGHKVISKTRVCRNIMKEAIGEIHRISIISSSNSIITIRMISNIMITIEGEAAIRVVAEVITKATVEEITKEAVEEAIIKAEEAEMDSTSKRGKLENCSRTPMNP